jgi:hypothetical protein
VTEDARRREAGDILAPLIDRAGSDGGGAVRAGDRQIDAPKEAMGSFTPVQGFLGQDTRSDGGDQIGAVALIEPVHRSEDTSLVAPVRVMRIAAMIHDFAGSMIALHALCRIGKTIR